MPRPFGDAYRNIRVCVDLCRNGEVSGQFGFPLLSAPDHPFRSLTEFLILADRAMDAAGYPQSFTDKRSFRPEAPLPPAPEVPRRETGKTATFDILVVYRQHSSWQGTVHWFEGGRQLSFRSALELLRLMDSALSEIPGGDEA